MHTLVAFTPLYYVVARDLIAAPEEIIGPARLGLMVTVPWTWAIAYRRFNQGLLIRSGYSLSVGTGTVVRLTTELLVLAIAYAVGSFPGAAVAGTTLSLGVLAEALYVGFRVRPVRRGLASESGDQNPLTVRSLLAFYIPLSLTSVLLFLANPLVSAGLSRMPRAIESLAVWPVIGAISFISRSFGVGFSEVVIATIDRPGAMKALRKFSIFVSFLGTAVFVLVALPQLRHVWYEALLGLSPSLARLLSRYLWLLLPLPVFATLQSYFQGIIVHGRITRGITESVAIFLVAACVILVAGVIAQPAVGLPIGLLAMTGGEALRTVWLWFRSRRMRRTLLGQL